MGNGSSFWRAAWKTPTAHSVGIFAEIETMRFQKHLSSVAVGAHGAATIRTGQMALVRRVPETKNAVGTTNVSRELQEAISGHPAGHLHGADGAGRHRA